MLANSLCLVRGAHPTEIMSKFLLQLIVIAILGLLWVILTATPAVATIVFSR